MDKQEIVQARRELLASEIEKRGLAVIARAAGKPDRQIKDMAAGRKSFGDGVAKEIGPKIRPDLPREWLVYPETVSSSPSEESSGRGTVTIIDLPPFPTLGEDWESFADAELKKPPKPVAIIPKSQRDKDIEEIISIARQLSDTGIGMLLGYSQKLLEERPAKQTESSSG